MIAANLIPALQERFRDRGLRISEASPPVATFPAIHPDVGDIVVCDDGDEVTVYLGNFTHAHFGVRSSDADGSVVDREQHIVDDVLDFLDDVFTDRIEFYRGALLAGIAHAVSKEASRACCLAGMRLSGQGQFQNESSNDELR